MKIVSIIIAHLVVIALLVYAGISWNNEIAQSQTKYTGLIAIFSIAWTLYITAINFLYQRNQAFHLFVNRVWLRLVRTHTYWQPHIAMELDSATLEAQKLDEIWGMLSLGSHGAAKQKSASFSKKCGVNVSIPAKTRMTFPASRKNGFVLRLLRPEGTTGN